ncbi:nucleoside triphosphate hydrolase [Sphingomonas sp.]|uniref:nucleoside triphosphate hydrolase n=1 Tax=Sphingomonas sp. TaxID=28214 RepID=UPI003B3B3FC7
MADEIMMPTARSDGQGPAPLIALVGSDGSGKSTVGANLLAWMREARPTELCHLGKQTGNIGRAIARWPVIGPRFAKTLRTKADKAQAPKGPGTLTAFVIYLFSMRRVRRFRHMLKIRRRGIAVLTDRFPQVEIPGPMDGLGLAAPGRGNWLIRTLSRWERRQYDWMVGHKPDLVIRLNVDFDTAIARKPDHRPSSLKTKISDVRQLTFGGAPIVDIDSAQPLDVVLDQAKRAIRETLAAERA